MSIRQFVCLTVCLPACQSVSVCAYLTLLTSFGGGRSLHHVLPKNTEKTVLLIPISKAVIMQYVFEIS